jgi:hypothetical protein
MIREALWYRGVGLHRDFAGTEVRLLQESHRCRGVINALKALVILECKDLTLHKNLLR